MKVKPVIINCMIPKEFQAHYDRLCYGRSRANVFRDFLDVCLYYLSAGMLSEDYLKIEKQYKKEEMPLFLEMLNVVADNSEGFRDVLGDVFMEFVSHGHNGQFFTPMPITDMMAMINNCDNLTPEQSVCDPACGSGRTLLSAVAMCVKNNEGKRPRCYGSDIDISCVKMAVINMMMNSIPGEIAWMDTLRMEHWRSYCIDLILIGGMWFPTLKVMGAGQTRFVQRLEKAIEEKPEIKEQIMTKVNPVQLSFGF